MFKLTGNSRIGCVSTFRLGSESCNVGDGTNKRHDVFCNGDKGDIRPSDCTGSLNSFPVVITTIRICLFYRRSRWHLGFNNTREGLNKVSTNIEKYIIIIQPNQDVERHQLRPFPCGECSRFRKHMSRDSVFRQGLLELDRTNRNLAIWNLIEWSVFPKQQRSKSLLYLHCSLVIFTEYYLIQLHLESFLLIRTYARCTITS